MSSATFWLSTSFRGPSTFEANGFLADMTSHAPAVSIRNLTRTIAGRNILEGINLDLAEGEFFALVGPSGSGKSTLLKMISGIDSPTQGEVWLDGKEITHLPAYQRPVHTVFQSYALFPHLNVAGNVRFPLKVAGVSGPEAERKVEAALKMVKLESMAKRSVATLSGGERQRVAIARALVDEPRCVLFDEPLAALDPHLRNSTLEMIQEIQRRLGLTYVYVTHDRQEALKAAGRCALMRDGKLVQVGTPQELYQQPTSVFSASFLGAISWIRAKRGERQTVTVEGESVAIELKQELPVGVNDFVVGIRPEDVQLGEDQPFKAVVESAEFGGARSLLKLRLRGGDVVLAESREGVSALRVGDSVRLGWDVKAMHLYPAEQATTGN